MIKKLTIFSILLVIAFSFSSCSTNENLVEPSVVNDLEEQLENEKEQVLSLQGEVEDMSGTVDNLTLEIGKKEEVITELENELAETIEKSGSSGNSNTLVSEAFEVMELIKNQDAAGLNLKVSPTRGLGFSPYQYVDTNEHIVFDQNNQIPNMFTDTTAYDWGEYDGSGEDISGEFASYYNEFVYDEEYINPHILGINTIVSSGNMINNIEDIYPNDEYVEFYFEGFDPQYAGMDWSSLTLVFEEVNGTYYLIEIVHGNWTI